jgi:signal transduction histidine kinase/CheY-like chemotaxis protein
VESVSRDGRRNFVTTLVPLGPDVQPVQCYFLVEDVTEQRQKDTEIAQGRRLRALGGLVGGIAHEFNNLLTPILIQADQLQIHAGNNQELHEGLGLIADTARRSADLTRRLLAFGRNRTRDAEVFELPVLVENVVALLRQTSDRRIHIECVLAPELPKLFLCSNDVHQILLNLLLNARDTLVEKLGRAPSSTWHAEIRIEAQARAADEVEPFVARRTQPESWIEVAVHDSGMGMPPGVVERVFEPFYTTKEVGRGTGLGLATVWHLVSELGGRVDVESTPGEGSCFRVALPVETAPIVVARPAPAPEVAPVSGEGLRVLIVDDEPMISKLLYSVLRSTGHRCVLVQHGADAWQRLSAAPEDFDALIMDLNMPELSGLELARRARSLPFKRPILVMSGNVTDQDRTELARIGVAGILYKPFTADDFMAAFRTHIVKG